MNGEGSPEVRIGDADREAAVSALGEHFAAGRLTKDEYDERSDRAWQARTASGLRPLFADLPPLRAAQPASHQPVPAGPLQPPRYSGWLFGMTVVPVLLVFVGLVVLTHLPVFLVLLVVWLFLARSGHRRWHDRRGYPRR